MSQIAPSPIRLADYQPPSWTITEVALEFDLERASSEVTATLSLRCDAPDAELRLDGEDLTLIDVVLNGELLKPSAYTQSDTALVVHAARGLSDCTLRTRVRVNPSANTRLEGLYASGSLLLTQCEAEGFRRITFFVDRPDVQARWRTTLRADKAAWPVLLAGGDRVAERDLPGGRHEVVWHNPHPTPCYLFALAAGPMARVSKTITGADGRAVELNVWVEGSDPEPCRYALGAVERALRWDEQRFGRCYDLGVFNVVAAQDFTMGAMENKGLNIFNARYILADECTATDADFMGIESVVGHEYFHNWSGNRVTVRDWFQLSLKEGLTVFRDQEFTADLHSRDLKRIDDVRLLRARQFAEDAGALAHPVRPAEYREINNFYTLTVYEKGAEIVRMLHTRLGEVAFRAGMDRYFADNDGRSATLEDFYAAHSAASGIDCRDMLAWYAQAGTPVLAVTRHFDAVSGDYTLHLAQQSPHNVPSAPPLPLPFRVALLNADGHALGAPDEHDAEPMPDGLLLRRAEHTLRWRGLSAEPLPVLNRGFSAPIRLRFALSPAERARIVQHETDGFARWDALNGLALDVLRARLGDEVAGLGAVDDAEAALSNAIGALLADPKAHPALVAECLALPDFDTVADALAVVTPEALVSARDALLDRLASTHRAVLARVVRDCAEAAAGALDDAAMAARSLRHAALAWLSRVDGGEAARAVWAEPSCLTTRLAALRSLVWTRADGHREALSAFAEEFAETPLVTDKWLALVASRPHSSALDDVEALLSGPHWSPTNPNRVRAIVGSFARSNPAAFHRADGAGYRFVITQIAALDAINPQVAARLLGAFEGMPRWSPSSRALAAAALAVLSAQTASRDVAEVLGRLSS